MIEIYEDKSADITQVFQIYMLFFVAIFVLFGNVKWEIKKRDYLDAIAEPLNFDNHTTVCLLNKKTNYTNHLQEYR